MNTYNNHKCECSHTYDIVNVIIDHPKGGVIVMGSDGRSHVVSKDCVGEQKREISEKY